MSSARRLIVNADGYGFGDGATRGVTDAIEGGFVTSISVNANFVDIEQLPVLLDAHPGLSVGVHLNPLVGRPCLPADRVPSLIGADGFFHHHDFRRRLRSGSIDMNELNSEFDAQVERVRHLAGNKLTHLDSQAHSHLWYFDLFVNLAHRWRVTRIRTNASLICLEAPRPRLARAVVYVSKPHVWAAHQYRRWQMRRARYHGLRSADRLVTVGYGGVGNKTHMDNWLRILRNLPAGTFEIFCHPAYPDETLRRWSYYQEERSRELNVLRRSELRKLATELGVQLISFAEI